MTWSERLQKLLDQIIPIVLLIGGFFGGRLVPPAQPQPPPIVVPVPPVTPPVVPLPPNPPPPPKAETVKAIVKWRTGNTGCTATIIGPRRADGKMDIFTAAHCTGRVGSKATIVTHDNKSYSVTVVVRESASDIAWAVTDEAVDLPYALLATKLPEPGARIWHQGWGVNKPGNRETGTVVGVSSDDLMLLMNIYFSSGDSGSGVFDEATGLVVSTVYGYQGRTGIGGHCLRAAQLRPKDSTPPA